MSERKTLKMSIAKWIAAIWAGVFALDFAVAYLLPEHLFVLLVLSLVFGFVLTIVAFYSAYKLATSRSPFSGLQAAYADEPGESWDEIVAEEEAPEEP